MPILDIVLIALVVIALSGLRVLMIPSDFVSLAHSLNDYLARQRPAKSGEDRDKN